MLLNDVPPLFLRRHSFFALPIFSFLAVCFWPCLVAERFISLPGFLLFCLHFSGNKLFSWPKTDCVVIVLMSGEIRRVLYFSFIVAHFNYCSETWHFCSKGAIEKLEKINERANELLRQLQSQTKIVGTLPLNAVFFRF